MAHPLLEEPELDPPGYEFRREALAESGDPLADVIPLPRRPETVAREDLRAGVEFILGQHGLAGKTDTIMRLSDAYALALAAAELGGAIA